MINISIESHRHLEYMVSHVIILRNYFCFPWQSVKIKALLLLKRLLKEHYTIRFVKVSGISGQKIGSHYKYVETVTGIETKPKCRFS